MSRGTRVRFGFWISALLLACVAADAAEPEPTRYDGRIGYSQDGMQGSRYKDVRLAFKAWTQEMARESNLSIGVDYYAVPAEAVEEYLNHRFDLMGLSAYTYGRDYTRIQGKTAHYWVVQRSDTPLEKILLVVRKAGGIDSVEALRGKRVGAGSDNRVAGVFIDRLLRERFHRGYAKVLGAFEEVDRDSTALLRTYFGKFDACIVPEHVYNLVAEMNPALPGEMRILSESSRIFPHVLMVGHNEMPEIMVRTYEKYAYNLENTQRGRQILELYKIRKVVRIDLADLEPLERYFDAYKALIQADGGSDE